MAPAARAAAESLACAVCATLPAPGKKLRSCERCKQRGLPATYYCSEECQKQGWPGHRAWHKEQKEWFEENVVEAVDEQERATAKAQARRAERTGCKYAQLLAVATEHGAEHDYRRAARKFREAIALNPMEPVAYHNLAVALGNAGDDARAAQMFLQASELYDDGSEMWAEATALAFNILQLPACAVEPKPPWWHDDALKALSARALAAAPSSNLVIEMRACVLSGMNTEWEAGTRTAAELREAAALFRREAAQAPLQKDQVESAQFAAQADRLAGAKEAVEAEARDKEAAVAAAARAEAEANADEAAKALLAEVEAEKAAAAARPAGKGKGKGTRRKGKR